ncbi:16S rRNA (uracil(1498)-N(3))-methyltransferase [Adlercreutzia sp. ZJ473]|uniref:RsmE family RNA methyltransferase n=1 Tax=Adlercreutzia sp. ZJ473 TaxID=2722822 RepID=UPI001553A205|nr:RsmE family RNA methyltransferase [Adlercreutzia sp. ZJ473]
MSLHQFFLDDQVLADEGAAVFPLRLAPDDARHARVLRLAPGEHVAVVDAARDYFECEVVSFDDAMPLVRIARRLDAPDDGPRVILLQGLAKGDKMETVIRHATEVGVEAFVPLRCARSVMKVDAKKAAAKRSRWQAVAKSAAMQAGRRAVPEVSEPLGLPEACELLANATAVLVCWEEAPQTATMRAALSDALAHAGCAVAADARVAVVVGPEGGLAPEEVERLLSCNPRARLVSLGPSILRTETAGVVAPALVLYELGGMGNAGGALGASEALGAGGL